MNKIRDADMREVLLNEFTKEQDFIFDPTTIVVHELDVCLGSAIIDIAVINGKINGFELKSERDNLERLPHQIKFYNKVFDTVTLVTSEKHYKKAIEIVPDWWGIQCITNNDENICIKTVRKENQNNNIDAFSLAQLLWKNELLELLKKHNIVKGVKSKTRLELGEIVANTFEVEYISNFIKTKLKTRNTWKALQLKQIYDDLLQ